MIISVGYRVKSIRGTQFRIWANNLIKEYLIKAYGLKSYWKNNEYLEEKIKLTKEFRPLSELLSKNILK